MSLQFTTTIELNNGISIANAYGRVTAIDNYTGTELAAALYVYSNEEAFTNGLASIDALPFVNSVNAPYNRATMGTDILDLATDAMIIGLEQQGYVATKTL
jgi:hypothetical protein